MPSDYDLWLSTPPADRAPLPRRERGEPSEYTHAQVIAHVHAYLRADDEDAALERIESIGGRELIELVEAELWARYERARKAARVAPELVEAVVA